MTPCKAEQKNKQELERIREEIEDAKKRLEEVDKEAEILEQVIARNWFSTTQFGAMCEK